MKSVFYDRDAATEYAHKWAFRRNPEYYNFDNIGGDCTNFVSQCIYAGAGVMNYTDTFGWYYNSLSDRAPAWSGVEFLYKFLVTNKSVGPYARHTSQNGLFIGDIIQLGREDGAFYHSLIVTETKAEILVTTHTYDGLDRPLSSYIYSQIRFLHIEGVRIW